MVHELKEVDDLLDGGRGDAVDKELVETAIQVMLFHQVVYSDTWGVPRDALSLLWSQRGFFERYFAAAGFRMRYEHREQMVALESHGRLYGWKQSRLKKDETLVRLFAALILEEGWRNGTMDEQGRVASDTDELAEMFRNLARCEPPSERRLADILGDLHRLGGVRIGDRDRFERVTSVTVLPGMRVHVSESHVDGLREWIEAGCPGDLFAPETARKANGGEVPGEADEDAIGEE
jgi:hypothetical protein